MKIDEKPDEAKEDLAYRALRGTIKKALTKQGWNEALLAVLANKDLSLLQRERRVIMGMKR